MLHTMLSCPLNMLYIPRSQDTSYNCASCSYRPLKYPLLLLFYTCFLNRAPAHNTGAKCFDMLKPNNDANQRIVVTAMGARRSSVWCRNGSAL